jgi:3-methyladenine DNA glycosylase AlkD
MMAAPPATSAATAHAVAFVAAHRDRAERDGAALAEHIHDPESFATTLRAVLDALGDPPYRAGQEHVAPGIGALHGVRWPLLRTLGRAFARATRHDAPTDLILVADRLLRERELEARWFAFGILERTVGTEPERSWQLLRRAAREAGDWITVDSLARPYAVGIAAEPYRWAELELLVYSPKPWERRLIASTVATLAHGRRADRPGAELVERSLPILGQLIGDDRPEVRKALAWAYRSLAALDAQAVVASLTDEADLAVRTDDGHRAWVIRDTLAKLPPADASGLLTRLAGIRRRPGAPSTATGPATAARFGALPDPTHWPEPPLG